MCNIIVTAILLSYNSHTVYVYGFHSSLLFCRHHTTRILCIPLNTHNIVYNFFIFPIFILPSENILSTVYLGHRHINVMDALEEFRLKLALVRAVQTTGMELLRGYQEYKTIGIVNTSMVMSSPSSIDLNIYNRGEKRKCVTDNVTEKVEKKIPLVNEVR